MENERRKGSVRVQFEPPVKVTVMAIDGSWSRKCFLIDVSDAGAQIELIGTFSPISEFFLMLSDGTHPAFRRCKRVWVDGARIGVLFNKSKIPKKVLERNSRNWEFTPKL